MIYFHFWIVEECIKIDKHNVLKCHPSTISISLNSSRSYVPPLERVDFFTQYD
jgi:hypothetical protein